VTELNVTKFHVMRAEIRVFWMRIVGAYQKIH